MDFKTTLDPSLGKDAPVYMAIATIIACADKKNIRDVTDKEIQDLWSRIKGYVK